MSAFSFLKYVRGYVYVHLTGYGAERFLNLCSNHDILIWNLKPVADGYEFCISTDGFRQLKPLFEKDENKSTDPKKTGASFPPVPLPETQNLRCRNPVLFVSAALRFRFYLEY